MKWPRCQTDRVGHISQWTLKQPIFKTIGMVTQYGKWHVLLVDWRRSQTNANETERVVLKITTSLCEFAIKIGERAPYKSPTATSLCFACERSILAKHSFEALNYSFNIFSIRHTSGSSNSDVTPPQQSRIKLDLVVWQPQWPWPIQPQYTTSKVTFVIKAMTTRVNNSDVLQNNLLKSWNINWTPPKYDMLFS